MLFLRFVYIFEPIGEDKREDALLGSSTQQLLAVHWRFIVNKPKVVLVNSKLSFH